MPSLQQPQSFNIKDLNLDVRLTAFTQKSGKIDFTGRNIFSVEFFRQNIGFGITDIDIEVNTSLQPLVTITFKDLYGNVIFGKSKVSNPDTGNSDVTDLSVLFNWPPPKFLFTFKGFLGSSATWMLNMKKSSVSYDASDSSYNVKCEFVPNQWGFFADLPFLFLLAVKGLKKQDGVSDEKLSQQVQTIFDLIKIGKQVEVKTQENTKEFDGLLNQMTAIKVKQIYDALDNSKTINFGTAVTGQVGPDTITPFNNVTFYNPTDNIISTVEGRRAYINGSNNLGSSSNTSPAGNNLVLLNNYLLLTAQIGNNPPIQNLSINNLVYSNGSITVSNAGSGAPGSDNKILPLPNGKNIDSEISQRLTLISQNIDNIEAAIKLKVYNSSKFQLQKITIGEIFSQIAQDSAYIMGKILENGYIGYQKNQTSRDNNKSLIGRNYPLWITGKNKEEKPATKFNSGIDFGVETYELAFVQNFIQAVTQGIATELASDADANSTVGDQLIKHRICNLEALQSNPYKPYFQNIAENILIRAGIVAYLVRSPDPNYPGDYDRTFGVDRGSKAADVIDLANKDVLNITDDMITNLSFQEFTQLKNFCIYWTNLLTADCNSLMSPDTSGRLVAGDSIGLYLSSIASPLSTASKNILKYKVPIQIPPNWNGTFDNQQGLIAWTLNDVISQVFSGKPPAGSSGLQNPDATNSNFIDTTSFQAIKVINNGLAYFKPRDSYGHLVPTTQYVFVKFSGPDALNTQKIASTESDSELSSKANEQKGKENPVGFVNIVNPFDEKGSPFEVITSMNKRIQNHLLLDYTKEINPNNDFYVENNVVSVSGQTYFTVNSQFETNASNTTSTSTTTTIPANNTAFSIVFHGSNDPLVFGPFANTEASNVQRGYIYSFCQQLLTRLKGIEEKAQKAVSNALGKANEQQDLIYKQMHNIYQQWETLIVDDYKTASGQKANVDSFSGSITNNLVKRFKTHETYNYGSMPNGGTSDTNSALFLYAYPLNNTKDASGNTVNVDVKKSIISLEPLYKPNGNTTVLSMITQLCTKNNFLFIPMPGDPNAFNTNSIFSPHRPNPITNITNFFFVQFTPTPESRATVDNASRRPLSSSSDPKANCPPGTLEVKFGSPDNQIVKNITVDTMENKPTAESIVNLQRLVDNENQNKTVTTDSSMLSVMEGRSYKATIDMLGNAQVFPMQFFYLDAIPLFNGLYQIMKVKHSIRPNEMSTSAEGIRMRLDYGLSTYGGIPPITLDTFINTDVALVSNAIPILNSNDFANAILDQGIGIQNNSSGTESAGFSGANYSPLISKGGSDIVPNSILSTAGVVLLPNIAGVGNSKRLTQSSTNDGAVPIGDTIDSRGNTIAKASDNILSMNNFIQDVLEPFALFLKQKYPQLYKNWYITSATRGYVPPGGSKTSQHQLGQAVDSQIIGKTQGVETMQANLQLLNAILEWYSTNPVGYDQILWETRKSQNASWIHWSYHRNQNRLTLLRFKDDRKYEPAAVNTIGKYVSPGVTQSQIVLSMV